MEPSLAVCFVDLETQLVGKAESGEFTCSKCDVIYSPGFGYGRWGKDDAGRITFDNVERSLWCLTPNHQEKALMVMRKDGKMFWGCVVKDCNETKEFMTDERRMALENRKL